MYLLEGQANGVAELRLTHSQHQPTHSHPSAHMFVGGVRGLDEHHESFGKQPAIR
jgi:hypothetical protein